MDILDIVKRKLPLDDNTDERILEMDIAEVGQSILNYCNRSDLPKELAFTIANMVVDLRTQINRESNTESSGTVKSIKEGDTQVTFEDFKKGIREVQIESLLYDYTSQLNRFRKLRW